MPDPYIITIILNTNRRDDTLACLDSLLKSTYRHHKAIVLDNASTDGSVEAIRAAFPTAEILELTDNLGYAGNNNVGIQAALDQDADWIFVLNEDTILDSGCLACLVEATASDSQIGIVGPMVYHHDEPDIIQSAGGHLNRYWEDSHIAANEPDHNQFSRPHPVDWISGCAILVKREVIEQVGMLDERFFYYWEETEWCIRANKQGWKIMHVPQAKLWHKGVQREYRPKPSVTYYKTRNRLMALAKHHAPLTTWFVAWSQILRTLTSWSIKPKWRNMREHRNAMWQGTIDFLRRRQGQRSA